MTYTWHTHDIHMTYTRHTHDIHMTYTWHTHDIHMTYTWHTHDIHMTYTWHTHDIHMRYTWHTHDIHMTYTWHTHDIHMYHVSCHFCTCFWPPAAGRVSSIHPSGEGLWPLRTLLAQLFRLAVLLAVLHRLRGGPKLSTDGDGLDFGCLVLAKRDEHHEPAWTLTVFLWKFAQKPAGLEDIAQLFFLCNASCHGACVPEDLPYTGRVSSSAGDQAQPIASDACDSRLCRCIPSEEEGRCSDGPFVWWIGILWR